MQKKQASDRKEKELEALRQNESWLRLIMENTSDGINIAEYDPQTNKRRLVICNDRYVEMSGHSREELMAAENLNRLSHPIVQDAPFKELVRAGRPSKGMSIWHRPDGKENYYEWTATPLKVGDKYYIIGIDRDVTEHKRAEEALRESEKTMRATLSATLDSALLIEPNGTILAVNDMAARGFGRSASELIGMNVRDTLRSDLVQQRLAQGDKVVRSGKPLRFEDEHDGIWLDHSVYPVFDSEGRVDRLAIFAADITDRKKAEEALQNSERDLRKRVRELNCLYQVTEVVNACGNSLDALLQGVTDILPESWQFPEKACARIAFGEKEYATDNFRESPLKLVADILVAGEKAGVVEIFCLKKSPPVDESSFLKEERSLIDTVAARVGRNIERIQTQQRLIVEQSALHEKNIALREVMAGVQDEKKEFGRRISRNVEKIVMPLLHALEQELPPGQRKYVDLLKGSLEEITLPFADRLSKEFATLTLAEIRICHMIRRGLSTKQIAGLQHVSPATVNKHRERIRRKLQITNKDVNLATYLETYMAEYGTQIK